jgi:glycosyltransferase involved in cell wall biosynthesis
LKLAVVEPTAQGGLLHYAVQLADALAQRGNAVDLIVPRGNELSSRDGPAHRRELLVDPVPSEDDRLTKSRMIRRARVASRMLRSWTRVNWQLRRGRYDAVVLTSDVDLSPVALAVIAITIARGARRVSGIGHSARPFNRWGGGELFVDSPMLNRLLRTLYSRLDVIFVHGERSRAEFEAAWSPRRLEVIPHGDERIFADHPPPVATQERLLFFGDWRKVKGLPVLMAAFDELLARRPDARLTIAGTPSPEDLDPDEVRRWAAARGDAVRILDRYVPVSEVSTLFGSARAVVTPYLAGYQSGVVHLAMTMARAVVASDVGDLGSVVIHGETGLVVAPDDPSALSVALERVLYEPGLAERMGAEAQRQLSRNASWELVAEHVEAALR